MHDSSYWLVPSKLSSYGWKLLINKSSRAAEERGKDWSFVFGERRLIAQGSDCQKGVHNLHVPDKISNNEVPVLSTGGVYNPQTRKQI